LLGYPFRFPVGEGLGPPETKENGDTSGRSKPLPYESKSQPRASPSLPLKGKPFTQTKYLINGGTTLA